MTPKKFQIGETFKDIHELINHLRTGKWVMYRGVPKHPQVISNMCLTQLNSMTNSGLIRKAERTENL